MTATMSKPARLNVDPRFNRLVADALRNGEQAARDRVGDNHEVDAQLENLTAYRDAAGVLAWLQETGAKLALPPLPTEDLINSVASYGGHWTELSTEFIYERRDVADKIEGIRLLREWLDLFETVCSIGTSDKVVLVMDCSEVL